MSSIPKNKEELENAIKTAAEKLFADYRTIPHECSRVPGVEGNVKGTEISVCDTVAYLLGWGILVIKWHTLKSRGEKIDFPESGYNWNQLGDLATNFHEQYKDWTYEKLLDEYETTLKKILTIISRTSNKDLYEKTWYKKYTFGRMIQFNTSSPMKNIRTKIRRFKRAKSL
ncbi:ClbS/DfsB family four-helix bundle protein [Maridesulfovibrio sp.]|uniref:ClbS/DfsB family four-helix bundle protein n=1 Tax=Maridesulfovibrio sp. TaxID=2795000 RepID=UPI0029F4963D|nr:ClbS/DfsB family four-helix bundle protein [Maridesulfovibrio sp.]